MCKILRVLQLLVWLDQCLENNVYKVLHTVKKNKAKINMVTLFFFFGLKMAFRSDFVLAAVYFAA